MPILLYLVSFLSALLLFQVQPIVSKFILPWFGGAPAVWTTALFFFQLVLLFGYLWSHKLVNLLPAHKQPYVQLFLLILAICTLPIIPSSNGQPLIQTNPALSIIALLAFSVGLPFFCLATNAPLTQSWAHGLGIKHPYRLYALSNCGSIIGLLSYPLLVERYLDGTQQARLWSACFILYALLFSFMIFYAPSSAQQKSAILSPIIPPVTNRFNSTLWFALSMVGSSILITATNYICRDICAVPLLWVIPLGLFLLAYVITFSSESFCNRTFWLLATNISFLILALPSVFKISLPLPAYLIFSFAAFFAITGLCNAELFKLKPPAEKLTSFYLITSLGSVVGSLLCSILAPHFLNSNFDFPISILTAIFCLVVIKLKESGGFRSNRRSIKSLAILSAAYVL